MIFMNYLPTTLLALCGLASFAPASAGQSFFIDTKAFTPEKIKLTQRKLEDLMVHECTSTGFTVHFRKETMISRGILSRNLTLIDPDCPAFDNETHYILNSDFQSCLTQIHMSDFQDPTILEGLANVTNQVIVYPPKPFTAGSSPDDEDSLASHYVPVVIPILCQYHVSRVMSGSEPPLPTDLPSSIAPGASSPTSSSEAVRPVLTTSGVKMEFYISEDFRSRLADGNVEISKGTPLYVEIIPTQDDIDNIHIKDCYLESLDDWNDDYINRYYLIEDGCQVDEKTTIISSPLTSLTPLKARFKFRMPGRAHRQLTYLACTVQACSDTASESLPRCTSQAEFCSSTDKRTDSDYETEVRSSSGFIVTKRTKDRVLIPEPIQATTTTTPKCPEPQAAVCDCSHIFDSIVTRATRRPEYSQSRNFVSTELTIGVAAGSFALGVLLTLALWFVHRSTDPMRRRKRANHISESDGDSQNSTTPIRLLSSTRNEFSQPSVTS